MPEDIVPLLHRRTDLSTFLIHLTRDHQQAAARDNLLSILIAGRIEARSCYGAAAVRASQDPDVAATQRCVCFSEAPLEQAWMLTREIAGRGVALSQYGVVFTKSYGRKRGANPVWYQDITPGHYWLTNPVNQLNEISRRGQSATIVSTPPDVTGPLILSPIPSEDPILKLTPFIEQMGPTTNSMKEFWWEREWRHVGDFLFMLPRVVAVLAPYAEHDALASDLAAGPGKTEEWVAGRVGFLDGTWGLERMIAALAGVDEEDAGPIPLYP